MPIAIIAQFRPLLAQLDCACLVKPFDLDWLLHLIQQHLRIDGSPV
ncbi:MAG: hypothetical protein HC822_17665 [Oscillochloris sp.]|nr:hypothetical protein [Oscillochloris sp.]